MFVRKCILKRQRQGHSPLITLNLPRSHRLSGHSRLNACVIQTKQKPYVLAIRHPSQFLPFCLLQAAMMWAWGRLRERIRVDTMEEHKQTQQYAQARVRVLGRRRALPTRKTTSKGCEWAPFCVYVSRVCYSLLCIHACRRCQWPRTALKDPLRVQTEKSGTLFLICDRICISTGSVGCNLNLLSLYSDLYSCIQVLVDHCFFFDMSTVPACLVVCGSRVQPLSYSQFLLGICFIFRIYTVPAGP